MSEANAGWKREGQTNVQDGDEKKGSNRNQMSEKKKGKTRAERKNSGLQREVMRVTPQSEVIQ